MTKTHYALRELRALKAGLVLCLMALAPGVRAQSLWQWVNADSNGEAEFVRDMAVDTVNGYVYAVGAYDNTGILGIGASGVDGFVTKSDLNGNIQWTQRIGSSGTDAALGVAVGTNGNVYVTGYYSSSAFLTFPAVVPTATAGGTDMFLACFTPTGAVSWVRTGGGVMNDMGTAVAVNGSGVFVHGNYFSTATFSGIVSSAAFNSGSKNRSMLLKYSAAGALQWHLDGGCGDNGNKDTEAERLAADEDGVYLTGSFETNQMRWYNATGNGLLATINATGADLNIYVCAVTNAGAMQWAHAVGNVGSDYLQGNAIAVGCSGVYIAGNTHNNSFFPGGVTVNVTGSPHDHMYVARLDKSTGNTLWVRTARGPDQHLTVAYDLAIHRGGSVLVSGQFKGSATFTDGTVINTSGGGGYEADAFVARYTPYGQMDWATVADGDKDNIPMALAVDASSGIYVGGYFDDSMFLPPFSITGNGNSQYFWGKFTDSSLNYWPVNPTNWLGPASLCASAAPLNLTSTLPAMTQGYVDAVIASNGVAAPNNIVNAPNGTTVLFGTNGWSLTGDFTDTVLTGSTYVIKWAKNAAVVGTAAMTLEASEDGSTWTTVTTAPTITATSSAYVNSVIQANVNTRYVRISKTATSAVAFRVDAITYYTGSLPGGTWSGLGVSGTTFTPTGLSGPITITYTVQLGSCAPRSTARTINVLPPTMGGSIVTAGSGTQCPGNNSGTLTLTGYVGTITGWESSTNNFATVTAIANTSPTLAYSNLAVTTAYRARVVSCGAAYSSSISITVADNTPPVIACPVNITTPTTSGCIAAVNYPLPTATENCGVPSLTRMAGPVTGGNFTLGTTTVTYRATDAAGNQSTCSFTVTVVDTVRPTIACPANLTVNAALGSCGANVTYTSISNDNCSAPTVMSTNASGSFFPIGTTPVTLTATDGAGNTRTCTFQVTVVDNQPPVIACPANIGVNAAPGACTATVIFPTMVVSDNCGAPTVSYAPASGSNFSVGTTTVTASASDGTNTSTCTFTVTVTDTQVPVLNGCPSNITVQAALSATGSNVNWTAPTASDNCGVSSLVRTMGQAPSTFFLIGTHAIQYRVTDVNGLTWTCDFTVTVISNGAPIIACPTNQTLANNGGTCGAAYTYGTPLVSDDQPLPASQPVQVDGSGYSSGSLFPVGTTVQTWRVTDSDGNATICSFTVQVVDNSLPTFTNCTADTTIAAQANACGAIYTYALPTHADNCAGAVMVLEQGLASNSLFPIGSTMVRYKVTDGQGNVAYCAFTVTVEDNSPPTLGACPGSLTLSVDANSCGAVHTFTPPVPADNCAAVLAQTSGPPSGAVFPIGATTVTFRATDAAGLWTECFFIVTVIDDEAPSFLNCPDTVTTTADNGLCGAVVTYSPPTVQDNCTAILIAPAGQTSGSFFPMGFTPVTYSVSDGVSTATCTFQVEVVDNQPPTIVDLPDDITLPNAVSACGSIVSWPEPTVMDNCPGSVVLTPVGPLFNGDPFPVGTTPVTYTATDGTNTILGTFLVTIEDNEDPTIQCPTDTAIAADGLCQAMFSEMMPVATDNCTVDSILQTTTFDFAQPFDVGPHTITYTAFDPELNSRACSFIVTVLDSTPPTITCLWAWPTVVYGDANCEASLPDLTTQQTYNDCNGIFSVVQVPPPGTMISDTTLVTTTVTDNAGLSTTTTDLFVVVDTIAPNFNNCPGPGTLIRYSDPGACSHLYTYPTITSTDNCDTDTESDHRTYLLEDGNATWQEVTGEANHALGPGTHDLYEVHHDDSGNADTCFWSVQVIDNILPTITVPGNMTVNVAAGTCGAPVNFNVIFGDNCALVSNAVSQASGSVFAVGTTTVNTAATDINGNSSTGAPFTITVVDNLAPTITCPTNISANAAPGTCGAVVIYNAPIGTDNCTGATTARTAGLASGSTFPIGVNSVTYSVTDAVGLSASCSFTVTVNAPAAPTLTYGAASFCGDNGFVNPTSVTPVGGTFSSSTLGAAMNTSNGSVDLSLLTASGQHTITYTIAGACPQSVSTSIQLSIPSDAGDTGSLSICSNAPPESLFPVLGPDAQAGGTWTGPGGTPFGGTYDPTIHASGIYSYTVVGTAPCANETETVTVTEQAAPGASIITSSPTTFCSGGSVTLTSSSATSNVWSNGATTPSINVTASGSYTVTVNSGDCSATSAATSVTVNPAPPTPTIAASGPTTFCPGGSLTLTSSSATGNLWSNGATTQSSTVLTSGNYTVTVTSGSCSATSTAIAITVADTQVSSITSCANVTATAAPGECSTIVTFAVTATDNCNPAPVITYSQGSSTAFNIGNTLVSATVNDGNGNTSTCTFNVTVNAASVDLAYGVTSVCQGSAILLPTIASPAGGVFSDANQSGTVDPVSGAFDPSIATPGFHTLGYVFPGACVSHDWFTINVTPILIAGTDNSATICDGASIDLSTLLSGAAAGGVWSSGPVVSAAGTYTYTVSNACGTNVASFTINVTMLDDNDACTIDVCNNGVVTHTPINVDDNDACTIDTCVNGLAVHTPVNVDDGDACTIDTCVNGLAVHTQVNVDDGDACTVDACVNGVAVHTQVNVDDGDACTIDTCVNGLAVHTPVNVDDNDACTTDTCVNGLAVHTPVNVDDGDACTVDACVNGVVTHTPIQPANAGDDNSATICQGTTIDLSTLTNGVTGGTWSSGPVVGAAGTYTYVVSNACGSDVASFTVTVNDAPNAGADNSTTICNGNSFDLSTLLSGADLGGTWSSGPVVSTAGSFTYSVNNGCGSDVAGFTVHVTVVDADAGSDLTVCGAEATTSAALAQGTGAWSLPWGLTPNGTLTQPALSVDATSYGSYTLLWTVTVGNCTAVDTMSILFVNPDVGLTVDAGPDQYLEVSNSTQMQGHAILGAEIDWWLLSGGGNVLVPNDTNTTVQDLAIGDNYFVLTASLGQCSSVSDTMIIHVDDLFIPEGYSPNGDGVNDRWEITGMAAFPGSSLKVFNRWGQLVYESEYYSNEWDGRALYGRELPDATYFYVLNLSAERTYNGHVIIKR